VLILPCRCGHVPVALLGGATARVGDPSGKSKERPVLDEETIARNSNGIGEILAKILEVLTLTGFLQGFMYGMMKFNGSAPHSLAGALGCGFKSCCS
jgi:tyrosyl-tRNA synthetase